jgi:hypothetical protein
VAHNASRHHDRRRAARAATEYRDERLGDPERAIAAAVGSGGDTDTVGSIVGGIVGARHGRSALSTRWIKGLRHMFGRSAALFSQRTQRILHVCMRSAMTIRTGAYLRGRRRGG